MKNIRILLTLLAMVMTFSALADCTWSERYDFLSCTYGTTEWVATNTVHQDFSGGYIHITQFLNAEGEVLCNRASVQGSAAWSAWLASYNSNDNTYWNGQYDGSLFCDDMEPWCSSEGIC